MPLERKNKKLRSKIEMKSRDVEKAKDTDKRVSYAKDFRSIESISFDLFQSEEYATFASSV